jgi:hypothetical protein
MPQFRSVSWLLALIFSATLLAACSSGENGTADGDAHDAWDAGSDPGADVADLGADVADQVDGGDEDPADSGTDQDNADSDLGENFAILAPANAQMCTLRNSQDLREVLGQKGILIFKEGLWILPRDSEYFELDLIERVELSPDGDPLVSSGPGQFTRTIQGTPDDGIYTYRLNQSFERAGEQFWLELTANFNVSGGVAQAPLITVDDQEILGTRCGPAVMASIASNTWQNSFVTCQFDNRDLFTPTRAEVSVENGDLIHFHMALSYVCCCFLPGDFAELTATSFFRGQEERHVTSFFRQAFTSQHHIFGQSLLAVFDQPVGSVHALMLIEADYAEPTLHYLDADLEIIETPTIANVEIVEE